MIFLLIFFYCDTSGDLFDESVTVSPDEKTIGDSHNDGNELTSGHVHIFTLKLIFFL